MQSCRYGRLEPFVIGAITHAPVRISESLGTGGTVIGLFEQTGFEQETVPLQSGDVLVAYTDGLTEAGA